MKRFLIAVCALATVGVASAADWLRSGTTLTEQGTDSPWVLTVSVANGTELSVSAVKTVGTNTDLDFSGAITDADGVAYTIVSLNGFSNKPITSLVFPKGIRTIGTYAFNSCKSLKTVTPLLPETLTTLGAGPFASCTALEGDVVFPAQALTLLKGGSSLGWFQSTKISSCDMSRATLTEIDVNAFRSCTSLKRVKLPQGLTTIGGWAFAYASSLETIEPLLPDTLTTLGMCPFYQCKALTGDVKLTNAAAVVTFTRNTGNGGLGAFEDCQKITSFEMTAGIFHNQMGEGVVDGRMFQGCSSLGSVVFPSNVTQLPYGNLFNKCGSLTNVTFLGWQAPSSFAETAFDGMAENKVRVFYPRLSPSWEALTATLKGWTPWDDATDAQRKAYTTLYPNETVPPLGLFKLNNLYGKTVWVNDLRAPDARSVYVIGSPVEADAAETPVTPSYGGHHDLVNGETLTLTAPAVAVYDGGEYRCTGHELSYETALRTWSDPVTRAATTCTIDAAGDKVWRLRWLWEPNGYALDATPMNAGGSVTCEPANSGLYAPDTVVTVTAAPVAGCRFVCWSGADAPTGDAAINPVATVTMDAAKELRPVFASDHWTYDGSKTLTDGNWSLTVTRSGTELSVTAATAVYGGCVLDFAQPIRDAEGTNYTVVSLDGFAKQPLTGLVFPAGIRVLKRDAFLDCTSLKTVTPFLPETLTDLGQQAFAGCTALEGDVVFSAQMTMLAEVSGLRGWFQATKITSCDMSRATLATIVSQAFRSCKDLVRVKLPQGLTKIGAYAFTDAFALETIEPLLPDTLATCEAGTFYNCRALAGDVKLTNAAASVVFRYADNGMGPFQGCAKITSFEMTARISTNLDGDGAVGQSMFSGCSSLHSVVLPANVTKMERASVFYGCTSLTNVFFRGTAPVMTGSYLFQSCPSGALRFFVPKDDSAWTKDFYEANVTPMDATLTAAYRAIHPEGKLPKGQFTLSGTKIWFCYWNPSPRKGLIVVVR